jgi:hypothetical protein
VFRRNVSARLCAAGRRARADSAGGVAGTGADCAWHAFATVSGEAFYYISQRAERAISFMPTAITDQRVIGIYFDRNRRVQRVAAYGIKDGRVFDFISRTTPTAGTDYNIISGLMHTLENSRMGIPGM